MPKILYFSRGRGFGHAIPDLMVVDRLESLRPDVNITLGSYADGLKAISSNGRSALDLEMELDDEYTQKELSALQRIIPSVEPDLIVTHEVFYALPVARKYNIPSVLITHWFFEELGDMTAFTGLLARFFNCATEIVIRDIESGHTVPPTLKVPVSFIGPILRTAEPLEDRGLSVRQELGVPADLPLIFVSMGGNSQSRRKEMLASAVETYMELDRKQYGLILIAGEDADYYRQKLIDFPYAVVKSWDWNILRLQAVSTLAITRGSFGTLCELARLGVPSISIIDGGNAVDTFHVMNLKRLGITVPVDFDEITENRLTTLVESILNSPQNQQEMAQAASVYQYDNAYQTAADIILSHLN